MISDLRIEFCGKVVLIICHTSNYYQINEMPEIWSKYQGNEENVSFTHS